MSVDDFLAWAVRQPGGWELFDGLPNAMSPERVVRGDLMIALDPPGIELTVGELIA